MSKILPANISRKSGLQTLSRQEKIWMGGALAAFLLGNITALAFDVWVVGLVPILALAVMAIFYFPDKMLLFTAALAPISVKTDFPGGFSLSLPSEPFLAIFLLLFWLRFILYNGYNKRILHHPISIILLAQLAWILFTSLTGTMPIVGIKYFINRLWFVSSFYLLIAGYMRKPSYIYTFIVIYAVAMLYPIIHGWIRHAPHGFNQEFSSKALNPYFTDHGIYAAVLTLFIPFMALAVFNRRTLNMSLWHQSICALMLIIFLIALRYSYTRAAWIGLAASVGFYVLILLRTRFKHLVLMAIVAAIVGALSYQAVIDNLKQNKTVSQTRKADVNKVISSISNISTDASNTERINRWNSALRMWKERPLLGWGPGAYMFQYAGFQLSREMTIISTRGGDMGNAHSEFLGPLAEQGVPGLLLIVALVVVMIQTALRIINDRTHFDARARLLVTGAVLGLITYWVHGLLNNYIEIEKAAIPMFALLAVITAVDLYYKQDAPTGVEAGEHRAD